MYIFQRLLLEAREYFITVKFDLNYAMLMATISLTDIDVKRFETNSKIVLFGSPLTLINWKLNIIPPFYLFYVKWHCIFLLKMKRFYFKHFMSVLNKNVTLRKLLIRAKWVFPGSRNLWYNGLYE
jgi:hypothetical protein